jgi:hypothetical protein
MNKKNRVFSFDDLICGLKGEDHEWRVSCASALAEMAEDDHSAMNIFIDILLSDEAEKEDLKPHAADFLINVFPKNKIYMNNLRVGLTNGNESTIKWTAYALQSMYPDSVNLLCELKMLKNHPNKLVRSEVRRAIKSILYPKMYKMQLSIERGIALSAYSVGCLGIVLSLAYVLFRFCFDR